MNSLGIDIGTYSIKVAEAEAVGKAYRIRSFHEYPLNQDPAKDNEIEILDILRQIRASLTENPPKIVVGLSQGKVAYRRVSFPFRERHKILKSLAFELEDDTPFSFADAIFDARISKYRGGLTDVLACASPKSYIADILQVFNDAGFDPDMITVETAGLSNLFEIWREAPLEEDSINLNEDDEAKTPEKIKGQIVLNLGHRRSQVIALREGYLVDASNVDWGGHNLVEAVAKKYSLHYVEAQKELISKSFVLAVNEGATRDQVAFSETIKSEIKLVGKELRLILMDMAARYNLEIETVILMGGTSKVKNLGPYLTQFLEVPVNRLKSIEMQSDLDFSTSARGELQCATAMGYAIEGLRKPKNPPLNLLKGEFARQGQNLKLFWDKWNYATITAAVLFALLCTHGIIRDYFAQDLVDEAYAKLSETATKVAQIKRTAVNPVAIEKFIKKKVSEENNLKLAEELQFINSALDVLNKISIVIPRKQDLSVDVRRFVVQYENVEIEGFSPNKAALNDWVNRLKAFAVGNQVTQLKSLSVKAPRGQTAFGYKFRVNRKSQDL